MIDTTNPKLKFYTLMYQFFTAPEFIDVVAERIVEIYEDERDSLTLPWTRLTTAELRQEYEEKNGYIHPRTTDFTDELVAAFAEDISPQLRTEAAQTLMWKYSRLAGYKGILLAHARRIRRMGKGGAATITLVVNDYRLFMLTMGVAVAPEMWGSQEDGKDPHGTIFGYQQPD